jgi:hypothetical protein
MNLVCGRRPCRLSTLPHFRKSRNPPSFSVIARMDRPTNRSCSAAGRSNVRQRIHFGLPPSPFKMPGSQPRRARSLSARLAARSAVALMQHNAAVEKGLLRRGHQFMPE